MMQWNARESDGNWSTGRDEWMGNVDSLFPFFVCFWFFVFFLVFFIYPPSSAPFVTSCWLVYIYLSIRIMPLYVCTFYVVQTTR
ncbi:hypothetical protein B0T13DRAFT_481748 [Neurospora crassa]|nr:hypothetical protein B0T13DRAFT_481748 [Neurospora crassa]